MHEWPESWKRSLRHLAAARFHLPERIEDEFYLEFMHHREFELALDELAELGIKYTGHAESTLFWHELALAAESMDLSQRAVEFHRNASGSDRE
jgi:hypothetical protein